MFFAVLIAGVDDVVEFFLVMISGREGCEVWDTLKGDERDKG